MLTPFPAVYPTEETKDFLVVWTQRKYLASKYQPLHANRTISSFRLTTSFLHAKNNLPFTFFFLDLTLTTLKTLREEINVEFHSIFRFFRQNVGMEHW